MMQIPTRSRMNISEMHRISLLIEPVQQSIKCRDICICKCGCFKIVVWEIAWQKLASQQVKTTSKTETSNIYEGVVVKDVFN